MSSQRRSSRRGKSTDDSFDTNGLNSKKVDQNASNSVDEWEVETVLSKQIKRDGSIHYLLKWKNYKGEPTWEPEYNCGCDRLIDDFEDVIKMKHQDVDLTSVTSFGDGGASDSSNSKKKHTKSVAKNAEPAYSSFTKTKTTAKRRI